MKELLHTRSTSPLESPDEWEEFLVAGYPGPASTKRKVSSVGADLDKQKEEFRDYEANARPAVREFCRLNHTHETCDSVQTDCLPPEGLTMLRYRSFHPWHCEDASSRLANDHDREMLPWILKFNQYDLHTGSLEAPDEERLRPFHQEPIREFFPEKIRW